MAGAPTEDEQTTEALARVRVVAGSLGIETSWLEAAAKRVGTAPVRYLRTWLDIEPSRLAVRCESPDALGLRPARNRYVELDSAGGEYELAVGTRPFSDDRALIESVPARALDALEKILEMLGHAHCDALGRLVEDKGSATSRKTAWTIALVESSGEGLPLIAAKLGAHAHRFGVSQVQSTLLQQAHVTLGVKGYTVMFTCDRVGLRREVTLEYRDVPWNHLVALTDALRPETSCEPALTVFAGALGSRETASTMAITYRAGKAAHIRVAIDRDDAGHAD